MCPITKVKLTNNFMTTFIAKQLLTRSCIILLMSLVNLTDSIIQQSVFFIVAHSLAVGAITALVYGDYMVYKTMRTKDVTLEFDKLAARITGNFNGVGNVRKVEQ